MKKILAKALVIAVAGVMALCAPVGSMGQVQAAGNDNVHKNAYDGHGKPMYSYIAQGQDNTFYRVESIPEYMYMEGENHKVTVEQYDANANLLKALELPCELELFGGFFAGKDANFFVFGQENKEEDDNKEVLRIVKYSKDWQRLGSTCLKGANTKVPFRAGSLRMCETNNILHIRTCHTMYKSGDGLNHQANLMIALDKAKMEIIDSQYAVWNISSGYVSHSFNQFVRVDNDRMVAIDHGDAYPRSIVFTRNEASADSGELLDSGVAYLQNKVCNVDILELSGKEGDNFTGATVGGFEVSGTHYLVAGSSMPQDSAKTDTDCYNLWVATLPKDNPGDDMVKFQYLTDYDRAGKVEVSTPQLVKVNDERFMLLWEERSVTQYFAFGYTGVFRTYSETPVVNYIMLDGQGNQLGDRQQISARLSDCQPTIINGKVMWYVTEGGVTKFYSISADTTNVENFVGRMYQVALNREAEAKGLADWTNRLLTGLVDGAGISQGFIESNEFTLRKLEDEDFVDTLYYTFFDREPDKDGKEYWMKLLKNGNSRRFVLCGFVNSGEFTNLCDRYHIQRGKLDDRGEVAKDIPSTPSTPTDSTGTRGFVERLYIKALNRAGEEAGVTDWTGQIQRKELTPEQAAKMIFGSQEFINRNLSNGDYVETLYQAFMDRASDEGGKANWVAALEAGEDRMKVLEGFSGSPEFAKIMESFGL